MQITTKKVVNSMIDGISGIFMPLVNLLSAAGILKGVLAILTAIAVISAKSETYIVLNAMADSLFYFLPVLLSATAAKKFGANPYTCIVIAGILLYPSLVSIMGNGTIIHFLGIPMKGVTYHSSVIPMIMAAGFLAFTERFLNRILPDMIKGFLTPLLCLIIVSFVTLFAFGPIGAVIGDVLAVGYKFVYSLSPVMAGILLGAFIQPMVIFGLQWSFVLIGMNNITVTGHDTVLALIGPAVFAQAGASLAVMLKSQDKGFKSVCAAAVLSALFGITEPAMFSVNLPRKKPMIAVCIGGALGGALAGISGAQAMAFAFPSLAALPVFFGKGIILYLVSCIVGFASSFALTMLMNFEIDMLPVEELRIERGETRMKYKHIIFDLDGTLIDTEEAVLKTWQFTLREYHYDYRLEELNVVLGITTRSALEKLNAVVDKDFEKHWKQNYRKFTYGMAFFDGVREMLSLLKKQGCSLGIVTSRAIDEYNDYFRPFNLDTLFDLIVCADDTEKHKPDPEPLYKYAELAKAKLESCIYIGDMPTDIECAYRAGVASGLVIWNNSGVLCQRAMYVFSSPKEVCDILCE